MSERTTAGFMFARLSEMLKHNRHRDVYELAEMILFLLRRPTRDMLDAGEEMRAKPASSAKDVWEAMIAEALGEVDA